MQNGRGIEPRPFFLLRVPQLTVNISVDWPSKLCLL